MWQLHQSVWGASNCYSSAIGVESVDNLEHALQELPLAHFKRFAIAPYHAAQIMAFCYTFCFVTLNLIVLCVPYLCLYFTLFFRWSRVDHIVGFWGHEASHCGFLNLTIYQS